ELAKGFNTMAEGLRRKQETQNRLMLELRHSKGAADAANHAKSTFLASMSHEIRTPMNAIIGLGHLLGKTALSARQSDYLDKINLSAEGLRRILDDILDFSKIEAGKLTLDPADFDLFDLIKDVTTLFADLAHRKGIRLETRMDPKLPRLAYGDGHRLRQILMNLMSNAVKFTDRGQVTLQVDTQPDQPHTLHFQVQDTGIGIPAPTLDRLFQPFTQADSSVTRRFGGSGLGLSISRNLAELMGGTVTAVSHPGQGSVFLATVPLEPGRREETPPQEAQEAMMLRSLPAQARLLVVEDDPINRQVLLGMLGKLGLEADVAENGRIGLTCMQSHPYDLVFMDCQMPEMDGLTASRLYRQMEAMENKPRRTPILALTAYALPVDKEKCLQAGMDAFLAKPIRKEKLHQALAQWLLLDPEPLPPEADPSAFHKPMALILDWQIFQELRQEIGESLDGICREFAQSLPTRVNDMQRACSQEEWHTLERYAHTLKTISAQFGATALSETVERIEHHCREGMGMRSRPLVELALQQGEETRCALELALGSFHAEGR
ncbi:MAG: response regulator, partial [Magnetococcales bacterium]|nr:response regulator [Magnetococcales bacterium]